jgi:putative oxidoreductase
MASVLTERPAWARANAILPSRLSLGASMLYHGASKLLPERHEQAVGFFEQIGFRPGRPYVLAVGWTELVSGALCIVGIGTRVTSLAILATQAVAISRVHAPHGFDASRQGYEFNLSLMATALGLLLAGPGRFSLHSRLERRLKRRELWRGRWLARQRTGSRLLDALG